MKPLLTQMCLLFAAAVCARASVVAPVPDATYQVRLSGTPGSQTYHAPGAYSLGPLSAALNGDPAASASADASGGTTTNTGGTASSTLTYLH